MHLKCVTNRLFVSACKTVGLIVDMYVSERKRNVFFLWWLRYASVCVHSWPVTARFIFQSWKSKVVIILWYILYWVLPWILEHKQPLLLFALLQEISEEIAAHGHDRLFAPILIWKHLCQCPIVQQQLTHCSVSVLYSVEQRGFACWRLHVYQFAHIFQHFSFPVCVCVCVFVLLRCVIIIMVTVTHPVVTLAFSLRFVSVFVFVFLFMFMFGVP